MKHRHHHIKHKIKGLRKKKSFLKSPVFWLVLFFTIIVLGIFYTVFFLPQIQVKAITISGNQKVATNDIQAVAWGQLNKKIWFVISSHSIFAVDTGAITTDILNTFPDISKADVQKKWFGAINIVATERVPRLVFCQPQNQCFYVDEYGVAFEDVSGVPQGMVVATVPSATSISLGQKALDPGQVDDILKMQKNLVNNFQLLIGQVLVSNPLVFTMVEGWQIYIDPNQDIDLQIIKLDSLLKEQITTDARKKLQYIYLQYKDRAYYK